jgi:hypothetical protein
MTGASTGFIIPGWPLFPDLSTGMRQTSQLANIVRVPLLRDLQVCMNLIRRLERTISETLSAAKASFAPCYAPCLEGWGATEKRRASTR